MVCTIALVISILYCTLLSGAQSEVEKTAVKNKMMMDNELIKILKQLEGERDDEDMEVDEKGQTIKGKP